MSVLVDSSIWSLSLRRKMAAAPQLLELTRLVQRGQVRIIGAVRQEVLSGISAAEIFSKVRDRLSEFPDMPVDTIHHERAAQFHNTCRNHGVQGSHNDFLICAVASLHHLTIFSTDEDIAHFAKHIPIRLHT